MLGLHVLLPEEPIGIPFIEEYNRTIALVEEKLKKEGSPMIFTDAKGKPLDAKTTPSASYFPSLKKIPLEDENEK